MNQTSLLREQLRLRAMTGQLAIRREEARLGKRRAKLMAEYLRALDHMKSLNDQQVKQLAAVEKLKVKLQNLGSDPHTPPTTPPASASESDEPPPLATPLSS